MTHVRYALWAALAGVFIPVMAVLNARLGKTLGEVIDAAFVLFAVGLLVTGLASLALTGSLPVPSALRLASPSQFAGGPIVAFYILSITMLAPKFGLGNAILFVMTAQIVTSACVDHFGLLGATQRPLSGLRATSLLTLLAGPAISQTSAARSAVP